MKRLASISVCAILIAVFSTVFAQEEATVGNEPTASSDPIAERLKPFGKVCMEGEDCGAAAPAVVAVAGRNGKEIYDAHCFACHATGVSEAPLVGSDKWDWRVEKGWDILLENTRNGLGTAMPPMGTCMNCTDDEFRAAIEYMINGE